jgi:subtilase-type serine protease
MSPFKSSVSLSAILVAASSLALAPAYATDISVSTTDTTAKTLTGTDTLTITSTGALQPSTNPAVTVDNKATNVTITNSGMLQTTNPSAGRAIRFSNTSNAPLSFTINNNAGATIQSSGDTINVNNNIASGTIVVNNSGLIQSTGVNNNNGQAIDFASINNTSTASITINNAATGVIQTADADAIRAGNGATVNNHGQIIANNFDTNTGADGIDFQNALSGTVHNYAGGVISGGRHGVNLSYSPGNGATNNATTSTLYVYNDAGGQIIGRNGSGVGVDVSAVVVNYGTISGRADNIPGVANGDGDGVDADYTATITNYGVIEGTGAKGVGSDGLTNTSQGVAMGGGTVKNMAGAIIRGQGDGILADNSSQGPAFSSVDIDNKGTIEGTKRYGIFLNSTMNNTITNSGTISGPVAAILFGSGDDKLNIRTGSVINGLVDGGAGYDTVSLSGNGIFAGSQNFEKMTVDSGQWQVTGTQSYTDGTSIAGGAELNVAGTLNGLVTVSAGGILSGNGTVSDFDAYGTVAPGNSIGLLNVTGNGRFRTGSTYQVQVNAAGQADQIHLNGKLTIDGGTVDVEAAPGAYNLSTNYKIITADGGVTGQFSGITTNYVFLTPSLSYGADDVTMTLLRNTTLLQSVAASGNQFAVAAAFDKAPTDNPIYLGLVTQTSINGARAAYDALSGEGIAAAQNAAFTAGSEFAGVAADKMQDWRTGQDAAGLNTFSGLPAGASAYAPRVKHASPIRVEPAPLAPQRQWRMWMTGFGGSARWSGEIAPGTATATSTRWGGALGLDYQVNPNLLLGVTAGGSESRFSLTSRSTSGTVGGFHTGVYGMLKNGDSYASASLNFSTFANRTTRGIAGVGATEIANGSFQSNEWRARLEVGHDFHMAFARVTPFLAMEAAALSTDGFSEVSRTLAGAPGILGLTFASHTTQSLPLFAGVRLAQTYNFASGIKVTPSLSLAWVHEFRPQRDISAVFASFPGIGFNVAGARPARDAAKVKAGLNVAMTDNVALYASFDGEFSGVSNSYGGRGGVLVRW